MVLSIDEVNDILDRVYDEFPEALFQELNGGVLDNGVTVEKYLISSEITQLGDVEDIEIPEAVKSDAINYEKEIPLLEKSGKT